MDTTSNPEKYPPSQLLELESRFFEAIKDDDRDTVISLLNDTLFQKYVSNADKLALAFVQVVLLNNVEMLKILESFGVDIAGTDCLFGENGVMHAARYGHTDMLCYLLSAGVDVNHQSENGSTAMHVAVENAKLDCLRALVKQRGIDMNIKDVSGLSPLLWAARLRDWEALKLLIDSGCNIHSTDCINRVNALHVSVDTKRAFWKGKTVTARDTINCIDLLIDSGIDINTVDIHGNTALVYAVSSDNFPAVKHLLKLNCDIERTGRDPQNERSAACFYFSQIPTYPGVVAGYDMTLVPLYTALSKLQIRTTKMLVAAGIKYHKLAREPAILSYFNKNKPMRSYLEATLCFPMSLAQCCRVIIRQSIGHGIMYKCDQLEIPEKLKEFILLSDIDTM